MQSASITHITHKCQQLTDSIGLRYFWVIFLNCFIACKNAFQVFSLITVSMFRQLNLHYLYKTT